MTREVTIEFGVFPDQLAAVELSTSMGWSGSIEVLTQGSPSVSVELSVPTGWSETLQVDSGVLLSQQWHDERQTLVEDDSLFTFENGELVTVSEEMNITSHFVGTELDAGVPASWSGYEYKGRMLREDLSGGIGVTFHSQQPGSPGHYRLSMYEPANVTAFDDRFHLSEGSGEWGGVGDLDSGITADPNVWYSFRILVFDLGIAGVQIQANVWANDSGAVVEPAGFQIDAIDTVGIYDQGTVGVWSMAAGKKRWKEFTVNESGSEETLPMIDPISLQVEVPVSFLAGASGSTAQLSATLLGGAGAQDVTGDVAWSTSSPTHLTIDGAGLATAADPGTSATVVITATYLSIAVTATVLVTSATGTPGAYQTSVTIGNITWFFDQAYLVEEIALGKMIVRPEISTGAQAPNNRVVISVVTPFPLFGRNGSMVDPKTDRGYSQAYDDRTDSGWEPSQGATYPLSLAPNQSVCSSRSLTILEFATPIPDVVGSLDAQPRLNDWSVLTCLSRVADGGATVDANTLRPPYVTNSTVGTWSKPINNTASVPVSSLPSLAYAGGPFFYSGGNVNPYVRYLRVCERDWCVHVQKEIGPQVHAKNNTPGDWETFGDALVDAMVLALVTNPATVPNGSGGFCTTSQREALLNAVLQIGSDLYYCGELLGGTFSGTTYGPGPASGSGSSETDESHYTDLAYIFANLFGYPVPDYTHRRPDKQMRYHTDIVGSIAPSSIVDEPGTGSIVTAPVGVSPSPEAQLMIGSGAVMQAVSGPPSGIDTHPSGLYDWMGLVAHGNRSPTKMVMWAEEEAINPTNSLGYHANPREWPDLVDRGNGKTGQALKGDLHSGVHIAPGGTLCGQKVMGRANWESWRSAPAYFDYVERWMFKEPGSHVQNEAYVIAVLNAGPGYGSLGGERSPGNAGSSFVTNMFMSHYEYVY